MEQRIRNIVFDIGGVLADFRIKEFLSEKGFDGTMIRRILNASVMSPYWGQFERGELTEEEALRGFASTDPEIERELNLAYANIEGMLTSRDYAIPLIQGLHGAGYKVFYLSNYSKKAYDECGESLAFMPYMDGGVVSFQVGLTKPDSRVYQLFLERYGTLMPIHEIAEQHGMSEDAVKKALSRMRQALRKHLEQEGYL